MLTRIGIITTITILLSGCLQNTAVPTSIAGSWFNHDRRTAGAIVDDQAVNAKANLALAKNKKIWKESHISTLSYNGTLLLVGQTTTANNRSTIENIVKPLTGVDKIYNQITIREPIPMKVRCNDTWITTQVKARIVSNRNIGINRVKVITEDSVVYLMGMLTKDEEESTIEEARHVTGVKRVVTVIEPMDGLGWNKESGLAPN